MKSLSLSKPLVIIMVGLPGAGKSFFAQQFSETFGAPVISYDRIRYELFGRLTVSREEHDLIERIARYQLAECLKAKHTCIVDGGGGSRADRLELRKTARSAGYDSLIIWVQTDDATARHRAIHRSKRRKGDSFNPALNPEEFLQHAKRVTSPSSDERYIVISGKHTYATQLKAVLTKLANPREEAEKITPPPARPTQSLASPGRRNILIR